MFNFNEALSFVRKYSCYNLKNIHDKNVTDEASESPTDVFGQVIETILLEANNDAVLFKKHYLETDYIGNRDGKELIAAHVLASLATFASDLIEQIIVNRDLLRNKLEENAMTSNQYIRV